MRLLSLAALLLSPFLLSPTLAQSEGEGEEPQGEGESAPLLEDGTPRIVGGTEVNPPFKYPWMATLFWKGQFVCGGSLIDDEWILTAAHCTVEFEARDLTVQLHRHYLVNSQASEGGIARQVSLTVVHPDYSPDRLEANDMALWKLSSPITGTQKLTLDTSGTYNKRGQVVHLLGWGSDQYGGSATELLLQAKTEIFDFNACNSLWGGGLDKNVHICAGYAKGGVDTCQGDSGGPMIVNIDSNPVQIGVVSFGYKCAEPNAPGVYSSVYGLRSFISQAMQPGRVYNSCVNDPCVHGYCHESIDQAYCGCVNGWAGAKCDIYSVAQSLAPFMPALVFTLLSVLMILAPLYW